MQHGIDFTWTDCITCGVRYAIPTPMYKFQVEKGGYHYCPNGHSQGWSKEESELVRIRRERDRLKQREAMLEDEKRASDQRAAKIEADLKRLKKRTVSGTCPCCQRTFSNMNTHMRKQHPEFVAEQTTNVVSIKKKA